MNPFLKYPFVRLTIFLIVGITAGLHIQLKPLFPGSIFFGLCLFYPTLVLFKENFRTIYLNIISGAIGAFTLILFGVFLVSFKNAQNDHGHFMYQQGQISHIEIVLTSCSKAKNGLKAEAIT